MKDLKKVVGENIKKFRKSEGLTQQELSRRTGISRGYIGDLENARKHSMSLVTLQKLSNKLGVSIPDLLKES